LGLLNKVDKSHLGRNNTAGKAATPKTARGDYNRTGGVEKGGAKERKSPH